MKNLGTVLPSHPAQSSPVLAQPRGHPGLRGLHARGRAALLASARWWGWCSGASGVSMGKKRRARWTWRRGWGVTKAMRRRSGGGSGCHGDGLVKSGDARHTPAGGGGQMVLWMDEGGVEALGHEQEEVEKGSGGRGNGSHRRLVLR
jgi:hypothetical protein